MRNLALVLGDQLSHTLSALDDFDDAQDRVWMAEVNAEATKVWCHKTRLVFFFSAMRHFRDELIDAGFAVDYHELTSDGRKDSGPDFASVLTASINRQRPKKVIMTHPGDWFVQDEIEQACDAAGIEIEVREDRHFVCTLDEFSEWAADRKTLTLEYFYRWIRKKHKILVDDDGKPIGGDWNFDKENRQSFGKDGPRAIEPVKRFEPDGVTRAVIEMVNKRYADHPGECDDFAYPVTSDQAKEALDDFIEHRLGGFGDYQDAMWSDTDFLNHSRLSAVLNVHLLDPLDVIDAAISAHQSGRAPINSVEGFVRQLIGWREFVRGVYWTHMPDYAEQNSLECDDRDVPQSYWDGQSEMNCIADSMRVVRHHAYAHHIQRLMVLGLFAQLLGVHPRKFHEWHMAMYADAIDWVSLPNALGMSQHADGGVVGTKPYCASGNYINKMSNYCKSCRFNPKKSVGQDACPVTTMYWDFLRRHENRFAENGRMAFQLKNLGNKDHEEMDAIAKQADKLRKNPP